ncbi:MAG: sensor histidine kinase, partial [Candidatus Ornithomonoglobus sp.]
MKRIKRDIIGYAILIIFGIAVMLSAWARSNNAIMPMMLRASFQGEYKTADGDWQPIVKGKSISAMQGDVTLRGYFRTDAPNGEPIGKTAGGSFIALYFNHIGAEIYINGEKEMIFGAEDPQLGVGSCGKQWIVYEYTGTEDDTVEIVLKNPHKFGNYNAVNDFLDSMYMQSSNIQSGIELEKLIQKQGNVGRITGYLIIVAALAVLGVVIFSYLLRLPQSKSVLLIALMMLFAGGYYVMDAPRLGLDESASVSASALQLCMMLSVFFMLRFISEYLSEKVKKLGKITAAAVGAAVGVFFIIMLAPDVRAYDLNLYWVLIQAPAAVIMLVCCAFSFKNADRNRTFLLVSFVLSLCAQLADIIATAVGWWQGGLMTKLVFALLFVAALVIVLRVIPANYRDAAEKQKMEAELQDSRISIMLSQIQPHFLHNMLTTIMYMCRTAPEEAEKTVGQFARYLRANMDSLTLKRCIPFETELNHVKTYWSLEEKRFCSDIRAVYEIEETGFMLPPLTLQPLVENAVKHGMRADKPLTVTIKTYSDANHYYIEIRDDGIGFDINEKKNDRNSHIGIKNVRDRLKM